MACVEEREELLIQLLRPGIIGFYKDDSEGI